jgi:hypothetical protein
VKVILRSGRNRQLFWACRVLKFEQRRNNWKRTAVVKSARAQALSHVIVVEKKTRSSSSREKKKGLAALWKDTKKHTRQVGAKLTTTSEKSEKEKREITFILRSDGGQA